MATWAGLRKVLAIFSHAQGSFQSNRHTDWRRELPSEISRHFDGQWVGNGSIRCGDGMSADRGRASAIRLAELRSWHIGGRKGRLFTVPPAHGRNNPATCHINNNHRSVRWLSGRNPLKHHGVSTGGMRGFIAQLDATARLVHPHLGRRCQ
jgi:hypothetical protein